MRNEGTDQPTAGGGREQARRCLVRGCVEPVMGFAGRGVPHCGRHRVALQSFAVSMRAWSRYGYSLQFSLLLVRDACVGRAPARNPVGAATKRAVKAGLGLLDLVDVLAAVYRRHTARARS